MTTSNTTDTRYFSINQDLEFRATTEPDGKRTVVGYAALFDKYSREMIGQTPQGTTRKFYEKIQAGAFDNTDFKDCVFNVEHDIKRSISRVGKGLLIKPDAKGLFFKLEFDTAERSTTEQNDFIKNIEQGIIIQCSWRGKIGSSKYGLDEDGLLIHTIETVEYCIDLCGSAMAAYPDTWLVKRTIADDSLLPKDKEPIPDEPKPQPQPEANEVEVMDMDVDILKLQ